MFFISFKNNFLLYNMRKKKNTPDEPKYSKKYNNDNKYYKSKSQHSILHKHNMRLVEFEKKNINFKDLEKKIFSIKDEIKNILNNKSKDETTNKDISNMNHKINKYNIQLNKLLKEKQNYCFTDEYNYLLESSYIMQEYITLEEEELQLLQINDLSMENSALLNEINLKKNRLTDLYLQKFDPEYLLNNYTQKYTLNENLSCVECNIKFEVEHSYLVCPQCGICKTTVEQANELSYKEMQEIDYRPQFTYDKRSHLDDWLKRFQAKENRSIPQEVLDKVILETKKERIHDLNTLTEDKIKKYLKKLNLNDYYDNVIGIINRINGRPPFELTPEIENKIQSMFQQIQEPYEKFKPQGRKNFLSYSYTLHKFFQILGLHEFAIYFPLLKSSDKLRQQDYIFKKIVDHMSQTDKNTKWVFYPSI